MSDNHDLLNDNNMCSFSGHEAEDMCFNCGNHTCGNCSSAVTREREARRRLFYCANGNRMIILRRNCI